MKLDQPFQDLHGLRIVATTLAHVVQPSTATRHKNQWSPLTTYLGLTSSSIVAWTSTLSPNPMWLTETKPQRFKRFRHYTSKAAQPFILWKMLSASSPMITPEQSKKFLDFVANCIQKFSKGVISNFSFRKTWMIFFQNRLQPRKCPQR